MGRSADLGEGAFTVGAVTDRDRWDTLVLSLPGYDIRQGYAWGESRACDGWTPHRYAVEDAHGGIAAISMLGRSLPGTGLSVLYASRGPLIDGKREEAWSALLGAVREVARRTRAVFLRVSPGFAAEDTAHAAALAQHGFVPLAMDWTVWNASRTVMMLDLGAPLDVLRRKVRKRYREYISSAANRGLSVRFGSSIDDVRSFHARLAAAGRGKGFPVRSREYFEQVWSQYGSRGDGVLLIGEQDGVPTAALLGARFGRKAYMLYTFSDGSNAHTGPLLYWTLICWAKEHGCQSVDFGGSGTDFPPDASSDGYGIYNCKRGVGSSLEYAAPYHDLVFRPLPYRLLRCAERWLSEAAWRVRARVNR